MQAVTGKQMREMDRRTMEELGVPGYVLMDRAGCGLAHVIRRLCALRGVPRPVVRLFAGKGNNGGDVFAAARYLAADGMDLEILLACDVDAVQGDARRHFQRLDGRIPVHTLVRPDQWEAWYVPDPVDVVVDGLLGTGAKGAPREPAASAIRVLERVGERATVIAVDMPSGVHAETGEVSEPAVRADWTVTMGCPKRGMLLPGGLDHVGSVQVLDIGIPAAFLPEEPAATLSVLTRADVAAVLPRRARSSHKGHFGRVLIVGGAPGYSGAVGLASRAACRSGAGLVSALVPESIAHTVAVLVPEVMVHAAPMQSEGGLAAHALDAIRSTLASFDAILVGPGMTCHPDGMKLLQQLADLEHPYLVMDADALNLLARMPDWRQRRAARTILTPHPGEAGRLLGQAASKVQSGREEAARAIVTRYGATVVLKGAGTLVADAQRMAINLTGNPGMATGGSGDVLGGMVCSLVAQGLDGFDASSSAVYLHGMAGDQAACCCSQAGLTPQQILGQLPSVFRACMGR